MIDLDLDFLVTTFLDMESFWGIVNTPRPEFSSIKKYILLFICKIGVT